MFHPSGPEKEDLFFKALAVLGDCEKQNTLAIRKTAGINGSMIKKNGEVRNFRAEK